MVVESNQRSERNETMLTIISAFVAVDAMPLPALLRNVLTLDKGARTTHRNDCDNCRFMGNATLDGVAVDLYYCTERGGEYVILGEAFQMSVSSADVSISKCAKKQDTKWIQMDDLFGRLKGMILF